MEQRYWLRRQREELAMAGKATSAQTRLIHFELAGRYSVKAANTGEVPLPFTVHRKVSEACSADLAPGGLENSAPGRSRMPFAHP